MSICHAPILSPHIVIAYIHPRARHVELCPSGSFRGEVDEVSGFKKFAAGIGLVVITCVTWLVSACSHTPTSTISIGPPEVDNSSPESTSTTTTEPPSQTSPAPAENPTITMVPSTVPPTTDATPAQIPPITSSVHDIDIASYRLSINGLVNNPVSMSYDQIQSYPAITQSAEVVCPDVEDEWDEWTGVPVSTLLKEAGLAPGASEVVFTGIDGYHIQLPVESVLQDGVFLAYKMNGATLLPERGYPLRLVVTGSQGNYWMRWVSKIEIKPALVSFSNSSAIIQNLRINIPTAGNKLCACLLRNLGFPLKL
jgi:hypothetical protein